MSEVLDIGPAIVWVIAAGQVMNFALTVWGLLSSGARANKTRLDGHATRLSEHDQRLTGVETALRDMPSKSDIHSLELSMSDVRGDLRAMREIMGRMETILSRHEDHLLDGGKR